MKKLVTTLTASLLVLASQEVSWAQIITQGRCDNAYGVPLSTAQSRYAWASYCRNHPVGGRNGALWLSDASIDDYNASDQYTKDRLFPTYLNFNNFSVWDIPDSAWSSGNDCSALPDGATNVGLCVAGCFPSDAVLTFESGDVGIKQALDEGRIDLVTVSPDAALDDLNFITNEVAAYSVDIFDTWQTIYTFTTAKGGTLRVTDEHPVLLHDGKMQQAKRLQVGDQLVRKNGSADAITDIGVERFFGKVYHVKPTTLDYSSNIIVAQGFLNGSSRYQNEFVDMINRVILRRALANANTDSTSSQRRR